ncbi:MAG TPA: flippase-like domain-containing protein, partial [Aminobacteriaceae bacterium]|nr:flippase-like domain-containing protein [Aminobacteriaceae bacterium]
MTLRKGLVLFLLLSFGVSALVLASSVDADTWRTITNADGRLLLLALVFVGAAWCCDAARFCSLARAAGEKIGFRLGMVLTWLHYFGCAVTPMQSGGGPFQVYVLYKKQVPLGKGIAITLTRTLLTLLILGLVVPVAVFIEPDLLKGKLFLKGVFSYVILFIVVSWVLVLLSILRPLLIK